jgi:hypothetical protein
MDRAVRGGNGFRIAISFGSWRCRDVSGVRAPQPVLHQVHSLKQRLKTRICAPGVQEVLALNEGKVDIAVPVLPLRALQTSHPLRRTRRNRSQACRCDRTNWRAFAPIPGYARDRQPDGRRGQVPPTIGERLTALAPSNSRLSSRSNRSPRRGARTRWSPGTVSQSTHAQSHTQAEGHTKWIGLKCQPDLLHGLRDSSRRD